MKRFTLPALRRYLASKPAKTWNGFSRDAGDGTHCVLGHLEQMTGAKATLYAEAEANEPILQMCFPLTTSRSPQPNVALAEINNGRDSRYQQKTPRARVLAAIDDLIARKVPKLP